MITHTLGFLSHKWSLDLSGGVAFLRPDPSQRPKLSALISVLITDLTTAPSPNTLPQIPSFWIHGCCLSQLGLQEKICQGNLTLQTGTHVSETWYRGSVEATLPGEKERAKKIYDVGGNCPLEPENQRTLLTWLYLTLTEVIGEHNHTTLFLWTLICLHLQASFVFLQASVSSVIVCGLLQLSRKFYSPMKSSVLLCVIVQDVQYIVFTQWSKLFLWLLCLLLIKKKKKNHVGFLSDKYIWL